MLHYGQHLNCASVPSEHMISVKLKKTITSALVIRFLLRMFNLTLLNVIICNHANVKIEEERTKKIVVNFLLVFIFRFC